MIIAIDFDGTLHVGEYPEIGAPYPYAIEIMRRLRADGHYLILWTCRTGYELVQAVNWILEKGIPIDRVNDHEPDNKTEFGIDARKVFADIYVDDRQVGGLPPWPEIYEYIKSKNDGC